MCVRECILLLVIAAAPMMASPMYMYDDTSAPEVRPLRTGHVNASATRDQMVDIGPAKNTSANYDATSPPNNDATSPPNNDAASPPEVRPLRSSNANATALRDQMFGIGPARNTSDNYSAIIAVDNFDCEAGQLLGNYADPDRHCSPVYYICAPSGVYRQMCPPSTFYDPELNECRYHDDIPECSGRARPPQMGDVGFNASGLEVATAATTSTPSTTSLPVLPGERVGLDQMLMHVFIVDEFSCRNMPSGNYASPDMCSSTFYACIGSHAVRMNCDDALRYSYELDACVEPELVYGCDEYMRAQKSPKPRRTTTTLAPHVTIALNATAQSDANQYL